MSPSFEKSIALAIVNIQKLNNTNIFLFLSEINLSKQKKLTIPFMKQNKHSINVCLTSDQLYINMKLKIQLL